MYIVIEKNRIAAKREDLQGVKEYLKTAAPEWEHEKIETTIMNQEKRLDSGLNIGFYDEDWFCRSFNIYSL